MYSVTGSCNGFIYILVLLRLNVTGWVLVNEIVPTSTVPKIVTSLPAISSISTSLSSPMLPAEVIGVEFLNLVILSLGTISIRIFGLTFLLILIKLATPSNSISPPSIKIIFPH